MEHHVGYSLHNLPQINSRMAILILDKISHITTDLVVFPASDRITLGLGTQLCNIWIWMRATCVWMVFVDQDHAFRGQHLLRLGTKTGYLTVVSRVPCARILCCAVRLKLCIIWIWTRPTGVWMISVDQDHAFWGQHLLQLGTRLGYSTVVSRVPCVRVLCCAARLEG